MADKSLAMDPLQIEARMLMAEVHLYSGRLDEALEWGKKTAEIDPTNADGLGNYAYLLVAAGKGKKAEAVITRAMTLLPQPAPWMYVALGNAYLIQGRNVEASHEYEKSIEVAPGWAAPYLGLAIALERMGRKEEAPQAMRKALLIDPTLSAETISPLGLIAYRFANYMGSLRAAGLPTQPGGSAVQGR